MPATVDDRTQHLLRELAPQVLGVMVRRYRDFPACEDAVQEALLAAATQWPTAGVPDSPRGWLITVASRRLTDPLRSDAARRQREDLDAIRDVPFTAVTSIAADPAIGLAPADDDTLTL